jgi:hypothetical protein
VGGPQWTDAISRLSPGVDVLVACLKMPLINGIDVYNIHERSRAAHSYGHHGHAQEHHGDLSLSMMLSRLDTQQAFDPLVPLNAWRRR